MATSTTTRKILMLHGYSQNAAIFSKRMGAIRKSCGKDVEFVFVDGPLVLQPADLVGQSQTQPTSFEALGAPEAASGDSDPALTPRAWWRKLEPSQTPSGKEVVLGLDDSIATLRDVLKADRFEGVFGFSQGASMAALLSALLERPHLHTPFLINGEPPHPPLKFCVAVSGFKAPGSLAAQIFDPSYSTPTLHVLGRTDIIVVEERSKILLAISENPRLEEHDGGHFVPSKANWRNFFRDFVSVSDPFATVPSPGSSSRSSSAPGSGAATPTTSMTAAVMKL